MNTLYRLINRKSGNILCENIETYEEAEEMLQDYKSTNIDANDNTKYPWIFWVQNYDLDSIQIENYIKK